MATQGFIRDQNLNVHFNGAPSGLKINNNKPQKNGGFGGRKALGDISNSRRPSSTIQPSKKLNSTNVMPVAEDFIPPKSKSSVGGKTKVSNKGAGRKALGDLTNSVKPPPVIQKLSAVVEGTDEHFLHDHEACIKAQEKAKALDLEYFLKGYGLGNSMQSPPPSPAKMKPESPIKVSELEVVFERRLHDDTSQFDKYEQLNEAFCGSPLSSPPRIQWDSDIMIFSLKSSP